MDRNAFESIVKIHQADIYRYMRYLGAPSTSAEDLVQETFLAALRQPGRWARLDVFQRGAWFRGIARNLFLQFCRKTRIAENAVDPAHLEEAEAIWQKDFLRDGDGYDYIDALRRCLKSLPNREKEAIALRYGEKRTSRKEMAASFNLSEDGIKSLLRRIRAALAECVSKRLALGGTR